MAYLASPVMKQIFPEFEEFKVRAVVRGPWRALPMVWVHVAKRGNVVTVRIDELKHKETIPMKERTSDRIYNTMIGNYKDKMFSTDLLSDMGHAEIGTIYVNESLALKAPHEFQTFGLELQWILPDRFRPSICLDFPAQLFGNYHRRPGSDCVGNGLTMPHTGIVRVESYGDEIRFLSDGVAIGGEGDGPQFYNWHDDEVVGFESCICTYNTTHTDRKRAVEDIGQSRTISKLPEQEESLTAENTRQKTEIASLKVEINKLRSIVAALKAFVDTLSSTGKE